MRSKPSAAVEAAVSAAANNLRPARQVDMTNGVVFRSSLVALITLCAHPLFGGVVLDGSFGTRGALPGPNFMIQSSFGKQVGGNLFQSFSQFNLNSTQSATFCGPNNVNNILARVTSGSSSSIDGTINSSIPGANLFLLNPAGVMFGQHAQVNVSGSFAVSTANYLKLADGGKFNTSLGGGDVLTSAPVSAFGFLNQTPARVSITGSNTIDSDGFIVPGLGLNVAPQKSFSVVAGDIGINAGYITGQGSRVNLLSVKSAGEAVLDATNINSTVDVAQFTAMGDINLTNLALIDTSGPRGGPVVIRGGNLYLDNSVISSNTSGPIQGGAIDLSLINSLVIEGFGFVNSFTSGSGNGGNVTLTANSLVIDHGAVLLGTGEGSGNSGNLTMTANSIVIDRTFVLLTSSGSGNAGNVTMTAHSIAIDDESTVSADTFDSGNGGNVTIAANSLLIDDFSRVLSNTYGSGNGGNISVQASDLTLRSGGQLSARTRFGSGNGGNVNVIADSFLIDGSSMPFATGIFANSVYGSGNAGNVTVQAGELTMIHGGQIGSGTFFGTGTGGNVNIIADSLIIDGTGGPDAPLAAIFADSVSEAGYYGDGSNSSGHAGNVMVKAGSLTLTNGGEISSSTSGSGDGGNVNVIADSLLVTGAGLFSSSGIFATADAVSSGNAGNVGVQARGLTITGGGEISSSTFGPGNGGTVSVSADLLLIDGLDSEISSATSGDGNAGEVLVHAGKLKIKDQGTITTTASGSGDAGSITVNAGDVKMKNGSFASSSSSSGEAGSIKLVSDGNISLLDHSSISVSALVNGGDITIEAPVLVSLFNSNIDAKAGNTGGNITVDSLALQLKNSTIKADATLQGGHIDLFLSFLVGPVKTVTSDGSLLLAFNSQVTATGGTSSGTVNVTAPELDLGAQLITLPSSLLSVENQLQERCTALLQGDFSSFISIGRGGTEPAPEELQVEF